MIHTGFTLTKDRAPCGGCAHGAGGCKVRSECFLWVEWEKRKALRYADTRRVRELQAVEFGIAGSVYRKASVKRAAGR